MTDYKDYDWMSDWSLEQEVVSLKEEMRLSHAPSSEVIVKMLALMERQMIINDELRTRLSALEDK